MMKYVTPQDLRSFGLIPEIVGRLPILTSLRPLDRAALRNILTEPKNSIIKQYVKLMEMDGVELVFEDDVLFGKVIIKNLIPRNKYNGLVEVNLVIYNQGGTMVMDTTTEAILRRRPEA